MLKTLACLAMCIYAFGSDDVTDVSDVGMKVFQQSSIISSIGLKLELIPGGGE